MYEVAGTGMPAATGYRHALATLRGAQKTSKGAPAYSLYVNRPLGRFAAAGAHVLKMSPNQVTALSAGCTLVGLLVIAISPPTLVSSLTAVLLLVVGYALDAADGQLARLGAGGTPAGEWLDHVVDSVKASLLHIAVLLCWWQHYDVTPVWYLVPLTYTAVATVFFFAMILTDQLRRQNRGSTAMFLKGEGHSSLLYSLAVAPTDYGVMILAFGLIWWTEGFLWMYSALLAANVIFLGLALPKWFREVRSFAR